ncbi:MAG: regulator of sigma E protease [Anaerolineaceae bacterium]|nr:MAG: regulator of sigma E protease [Anaerolineaceae bacterium]
MSTTFLGGVIFVVVFAGIILVHELGHFFAGRLLRIEVEEFGIFIPPRLLRLWRSKGSLVIGKKRVVIPRNTDLPFDHKTAVPRVVDATADEVDGKLVLRSIKFAAAEDRQPVPPPPAAAEKGQPARADEEQPVIKGSPKLNEETGAVRLSGPLTEVSPGTEFTLNWIPLGGFNRFKGEENPNIPGGMAAASPGKRILVLVAGAAMNLLTAVIVFMALFSQTGVPDPTRTGILQVMAGMPAEAAGFQAGDILLSVAGESVQSTDQAIAIINAHPGQEIIITVQRGDETIAIAVTPQAADSDGLGRIGVALGNPYRPANSIWETIPVSFEATYGFTEQLLAFPGQLIAGTLTPEEAQVAGPRTIWNLFQQAVARDTASSQTAAPSYYTLWLIISLTVSVGVFNLLPIPALDGGRIFMALIEIVFRRRIPAKYQMAINGIGFIILFTLLGVFYIKDIISPAVITLP